MMGERRVMQEVLFYGFSLERHVPNDHLLRKIDRFVDLSGVRAHLEPYYSEVGRPSIDPELMIRMLIVGYCLGVRSERRLLHQSAILRPARRLGRDHQSSDQAPVWLLMASDWLFNLSSVPFMPRLRMVVAIGRLKWIFPTQNTPESHGHDGVDGRATVIA
jgi:hypothetical protein